MIYDAPDIAKADEIIESRAADRILVWFSCGAPSAVAAKLAIQDYGHDRVVVVNNDTKNSEHPDNYRFFNDILLSPIK